MATFLKLGVFGSFVLVAMGGTAVMPPNSSEQFSQTKARFTASTNCMIKGNISYGSREKIYHVQGQKYYDVTEIRPYYGERWFCTEADARAAGWRRAWQ